MRKLISKIVHIIRKFIKKNDDYFKPWKSRERKTRKTRKIRRLKTLKLKKRIKQNNRANFIKLIIIRPKTARPYGKQFRRPAALIRSFGRRREGKSLIRAEIL